MSRQRVVVTGIGCISALGKNHNEFWDNLISGKSGITNIKNIDSNQLRFKLGAEISDFDNTDYFEPKELNWLDRFSQFALIAASEAIKDANLVNTDLNNSLTSVITGSCVGGKNTEDQGFYRLYHQKKASCPPNTIPNTMANAGASHIASKFGISGPVFTFSTACASSTHAIGHAFWMIRNGIINRAITGGSEAPFSLGHLKAWEALRVVSSDACRPFSKNRSGMILGEGGAMLVLESLASAQQRNANIYAEITGFGMSSDAAHITDPSSAGQCQVIKATLNDANLQPSEIQYYNAHGTGTIANDKTETATIRAMFPDAQKHLLVSSTKAAHGHLLGATGAIEAIASILAIKNKTIPPTLNYSEKDVLCDLPLVVNDAVAHNINHALCSSFAFGGINAALILSRYTE